MLPDAPQGTSNAKGAGLPLLTAGLLLAVGLGLTVAAVVRLQSHAEAESRTRLLLETDRLALSIQSQLSRPMLGLQALAGLPRTEAGPDASPLAGWLAAQSTGATYPGVRYLGHVVRTSSKDDHFALRALANGQGLAATHELSAADQAAIYNTLIKATATGKPGLSTGLTATAAGTAPPASERAECWLWQPLYKGGAVPADAAARQAALSGALFAAVDLKQLLAPALTLAAGQLDFVIADGAEPDAPVLFASAWDNPAQDARFDNALAQRPHYLEKPLELEGHPLLLRVAGTRAFAQAVDHDEASIAGAFGVTVSVLLAGMFWLLTRARSLAIAQTGQAQLKAEREDLQAILQGTHAGTWEWEVPSGRVIINARWAEIMGYTLAELGEVRMDFWLALCHPDDLEGTQLQLERHFNGAVDFFECELRIRHRDGHWVWVQTRGKVSEWAGERKPQWMSGIHMDVSAQKRLQNELAQSNRVMQSILDNIPVGLCVFDRDLRLVARNEKFQTLLDLPDWLFEHPDTTYETLIRFNADRGEYGSEDVERSVRALVAKARVAEHHQLERLRPNGMALEVRGAPLPGGGLITLYADVSKRRQADIDISRAKNMLQSVLDSASEVAVVTVDLGNNITLFNKGAERLLGYDAAQVIGQRSPALFFDPAEIEARGSAMSAMLGRRIEGLQCLVDEHVLGKRNEWTYIHRDGHRFSVALVVTPLTDASGVRTGYLSVSHDITQEKEHEARLQIAMEVAEQASNAKGQFLANMSHEIRTPMNAILGMLQLMHHTRLDARQLDYTTKTESAARSLLGLLNDILDFSKTEAGKMELDPQAFSLDALLCDLSVILSANVGNKRIEVLFDVDPALPDALVGDSLRLQQILINLAGNAIKFTEHGEVVVSIHSVEQTATTSGMRIAVRDSGIGIDPKNQQHIFIGFSQAEASTTRRFGGTGLGLSICRRLIAMMGGELQLQSALGKGSTFYFNITLPRVLDADAPALPLTTTANPGRDDEKPHVLVIDSNPTARHLIGAQCSALGWSVDLADSGASGLECMDFRARTGRAPYRVVVLDWYLQGLGAEALVQQIQHNHPHAARIAMVRAADRETLAASSGGSAPALHGFLVKPLTGSMLKAVLAEAVDGGANLGSTKAFKDAGALPGQRLSGLRILVVEDNPINQQVARELLSLEGAYIEIADNGQSGVQAVAQAQPMYALVLMDLQMPVMDGFTAAVTIRHELGLHALPIVAMTANAMSSDREACLAAGMNDHIGKPFDLRVLIDLIRHHTGNAAISDTVDALLPKTSPPSMPDTPPPPADLQALQTGCVDATGALVLLGGNEALYAQIARAFLEEISTLPQRLAPLLQAQDLSEATRVLHTTKGLALTLGAQHLSGVCRQGELALKAAHAEGVPLQVSALAGINAQIQESVLATASTLQRALHTMQTTVSQPACAAAVELDVESLVADLKVLESLLAQSDMRAVDTHKQICRTHTAAAGQLAGLNTALQAFDFERAVVQCGVLLREFGLHKQK